MGFIDEVNKEIRATGYRCRLCTLLDQMKTETRNEIITVLADKNIATEPIVRALNNRGIEVGSSSVRKHRMRCVIS